MPSRITKEQIARFGHIARNINAALKKKGMSRRELGLAMRPDSANPSGYVHTWVNGLAAPTEENRKRLSEILDIPLEALVARPLNTNGAKPTAPVALEVSEPRLVPVRRSTAIPLSFQVTADGRALITMNLECSLERGQQLLKLLFEMPDVMPQTEPEQS